MLIEFAVQNFKSFKELQVLSLLATKDEDYDDSVRRVVEKSGERIVKAKAIYGANGSGKSNLILALVAMWNIIQDNLKDDNILQKYILPYRLDSNLPATPTYFQLIFMYEGKRYRYGFEADGRKIHTEWLFVKKEKEVMLFEREGTTSFLYNESSFKEGKLIKQGIKMFTDKTLVIAILDQLSSPISTLIREYIINKIMVSTSPVDDAQALWQYTLHSFEQDDAFRIWAVALLREVDKSIIDAQLQELTFPNGQLLKIPVIIRNIANERIKFMLETEEAAGTKKIFEYADAIYHCLKEGNVLIIDELDALLHPKLTRKVIELFQSPAAHEDAQLIFATHDTNLMAADLLRRDQITFVEKSLQGASEIYNLSDIKGVRANDLFEKNYLKGNYGALPILNNFEQMLLP